jgi:hypothetical protein
MVSSIDRVPVECDDCNDDCDDDMDMEIDSTNVIIDG